MSPRLVATALASAIALTPALARAQLHWDASAKVSMAKRFLVDRPPGGGDALVGPAVELAGHVALLPLVRAGLYAGYELSPVSGAAATRDIASGGVHLKLMSPWPRGAVRAWLLTGIGYAAVHGRSYRAEGASIPSAGGGFFEVPFGLGISYKVRKPWEIFLEVTGRASFAHGGSLYATPDNLADPRNHAGTDAFAFGLGAGVLVDM